MRTFYRVSNVHTAQGLWYDFAGNFTGLIHSEFDFCLHNELRMDYDPELVGWLSATENLKDLWFWFPKEDISRLEKHGWFINEYAVGENDIKWYDPFQHYVIRQSKAIFVRQIPILNL
jgi:hypothetical protein